MKLPFAEDFFLPDIAILDPEMTAEVLDVIESLKQEGRDFIPGATAALLTLSTALILFL